MLLSCVLALRKDAMRVKIKEIRNTLLHWDKYLILSLHFTISSS